jgi:hypothetical protein
MPLGCNPHFGTGITCQHRLATVVSPTWSLITSFNRSSLHSTFTATLATLLVPAPFSLQATDYGDILPGSHWPIPVTREGGALWNSCISYTFTMSHWSNKTNRLLPATGGSGSCHGGATHTLELELPVSAVSLHFIIWLIEQSVGGLQGMRGLRGRGGGGVGMWAAAYTQQQLSAVRFISQIIKDN